MIEGNKMMLASVLAGLLVVLTPAASAQMEDNITILDKAVELNSQGEYAGQFDTLIAAVEASGPEVSETLSDEAGNYTVFAPTDDAFSQLGIDETNVEQVSGEQLNQILTYHVVEEEIRSEDLTSATSVDTLSGQPVTIEPAVVDQQNRTARIIVADIQASNGVIHVIDSVLVPSEMNSSTAN